MASDTRRLLLVHAHPDDEVIQNGITMAKYAAEGASVTLITCTLGEQGEVLVPELAHLAADQEDLLGQHRIGELAESMAILGVTDHRFLGGAGRYRDSGMAYDDRGLVTAPPEVSADSFWKADLLEASVHLVEVIREVRPQVLVAYDEFGNYGHPDHVQAGRVALYAAQLAGIAGWRTDLGPDWTIARTVWSTMSETDMRSWIREMREAGDTESFGGIDPDGELPLRATPDEFLAARISEPALIDRKVTAMLAHATQIRPDGQFFGPDGTTSERWATEYFRLAAGVPFPGTRPADDLFAGIA